MSQPHNSVSQYIALIAKVSGRPIEDVRRLTLAEANALLLAALERRQRRQRRIAAGLRALRVAWHVVNGRIGEAVATARGTR